MAHLHAYNRKLRDVMSSMSPGAKNTTISNVQCGIPIGKSNEKLLFFETYRTPFWNLIWVLLNPLGAILGPSWGRLESLWGHLGPSWGHVGGHWRLIETILAPLESS